MSTFTRYAIEEQSTIIEKSTGLLHEIRTSKASIKDSAALEVLTNLQVSLIALRTQAGDVLKHLQTAERTGEHRQTCLPFDHKRAAANDHDDDHLQPTMQS